MDDKISLQGGSPWLCALWSSVQDIAGTVRHTLWVPSARADGSSRTSRGSFPRRSSTQDSNTIHTNHQDLTQSPLSSTEAQKVINTNGLEEYDVEFFEKEGLEQHNKLRRQHGVPDLKLNKEMCARAREWAVLLFRCNKFRQRPDDKYSQNLYVTMGAEQGRIPPTAEEACQYWYDEIADFRFGVEPETIASGNFTNIIWKNTTDLGMAMAMGVTKDNMFKALIVADYFPRANVIGQYIANCPRPISHRGAGEAKEEDFDKVAIEGLAYHNKYRQRHGVPELSLSKELCSLARDWASYLHTQDRLYIRPDCSYGENIYKCTKCCPRCTSPARDACRTWYGEIKKHSFDAEPENPRETGNFAQMVWRDSKKLGMGHVASEDAVTVVAYYNPGGNVAGHFTLNCPPPLRIPASARPVSLEARSVRI